MTSTASSAVAEKLPTENAAETSGANVANVDKLRWRENLPFWLVHAVALGTAIWVGFSAEALAWLLGSYAVRMFGITGGYHRYFSHRTYKTSRAFQFVLALIGISSVQKGPLWWAAHHRWHHKHSDDELDVHSPRQRGFWWSHMFWILAKKYRATETDRVKDLAAYPELRWLDRNDLLMAVVFGFAFYFVGGMTALVWGYFVSTVMLWHCTFFINSLAHVWGNRRYQTTDDSRNNAFLAILTLGEGWHNNHHHYQRSARQGFYWWEIDLSYYVLLALQSVRLVWDVQGVPRHVRDQTVAPGRERVAASVAPAAATDP
jgi:stearoyl-CoA desaturase (Delta-9 desaturase)